MLVVARLAFFFTHILTMNYKPAKERLYRSYFFRLARLVPETRLAGAKEQGAFKKAFSSRQKLVRFWFRRDPHWSGRSFALFLKTFSRRRSKKHTMVRYGKTCPLPVASAPDEDWKLTCNGFSPLFWGPPAWALFHNLEAQTRDKTGVLSFVRAACRVLPCRECRLNVKKSLHALGDESPLSAEKKLKRFHFLVNCHLQKRKDTGKRYDYRRYVRSKDLCLSLE